MKFDFSASFKSLKELELGSALPVGPSEFQAFLLMLLSKTPALRISLAMKKIQPVQSNS